MKKINLLTSLCFLLASSPLIAAKQSTGELVQAERLPLWEASVIAVQASKIEINESSRADLKFNLDEFPTLSDVQAYRITFTTHNHKKEIIQTTGLILFPSMAQAPLRFLSHQHATRMNPKEAPTSLMVDPEARAHLILHASSCCVVTMSDYLGLDKLNDLPQFYLNSEIQARVAFDLIMATKKFLKQESRAFVNEVFISGYSQGAHNALALHKYIETTQSKNMKVLATSIMSGAYNLSSMARKVFDEELKVKISPVFLALAIQGMHEAYPDFPRYTDILLEPYASQLPELLKRGKYNDILKALPKDMTSLFDIAKVLNIIDEGNEHPFWRALIENDVDSFVPKAPVLMIHSVEDDVIPYSTAEESYQRLIELEPQNPSISFISEKGSHIDVAFPAFLQTAHFFKQF